MEDKLVEYTKKLVEIPSIIGNEKEIADYVESFLRNFYPASNLIRHNNSIIAFDNFDENKKTVAFLGHLDTVPGENEFTGQIKDGKLYGLGASDMKSGLAVMMALVEYFKDKDKSFNTIYIFYEKEEGPYLDNGLEPLLKEYQLIQKSDLAFALEPTDNKLQVGCLGTMHARVVFKGKRAHSARPWQGDNAIHKSADFLKRLSEFGVREYQFEGLSFKEVMNATMVEYEGGRNIIPEKFVVNVNYRFAPGKSIEEAKREVLELVKDEAGVEFTDLCPSGRVCLDNPILKDFVSRFKLPIEAKQAWTDVARLSLYGIDAVNFGPGNSSQAHQRNEYVEIKNIIKNFEIFKNFLEKAP